MFEVWVVKNKKCVRVKAPFEIKDIFYKILSTLKIENGGGSEKKNF